MSDNFLAQVLKQCRNLFIFLGSLFWGLAPLALFLISFYLPFFVWHISYEQYVSLLGILIWPFTILVALFFFKKIATYMFFSMDGFNFFGVKGGLRNVQEVMNEEVSKRIFEEKAREKQQAEMKKKEEELNQAHGSIDEMRKLAKDVLHEWRKADKERTELQQKIIELENSGRVAVQSSTVPNDSVQIGSSDRTENLQSSSPQTP